MSSDPIRNLPSPVENAGTIAKLVTGVAAAFTAVWYPEAGIAGAVLPFIIDHYVERPRKILLEELKKGNIQDLSAEQVAPLCPMTYKFLEAAKEGECEHNLRILAAYLVGELKQKAADDPAARFSRMVRRVEGLSDIDLKVMSLIDISDSTTVRTSTDEGTERTRPFVGANFLKNSQHNKWGLTRTDIQESIQDLAGRGFLIPDGATRLSKSEEYYRGSQAFLDLMERARDHIARPDVTDDSAAAPETRPRAAAT